LRKDRWNGPSSPLLTQPFDGLYLLCSLRLHGKHQASSNSLTIHDDGACPANSMLAAHMRSREHENVAQEVRQGEAGLHVFFDCSPVHGASYLDGGH
jgi:hypothetical protein